MPPKKKIPLSKEEKAKKKSEQAKKRLEKIKNDPVSLAEYKEKERLKYLRKKEKGQRKCVKDMTPREHRKVKKNWITYSAAYRQNKKVVKHADKYIDENTPPTSDGENGLQVPQQRNLEQQVDDINVPCIADRRQAEAKRRSILQRKIRNKQLRKKNQVIAELKKKIASQRQKYKRLKCHIKKSKKALTPRSKINELANDPNQKAELVKKALFGEVIQTQILEKKQETKTYKEKNRLKMALSGSIVKKYKIWRLGGKAVTYKNMGFNRTKSTKKNSKNKMIAIIRQFYEDDSNSRCAAGKKECITRNGIKKQKRFLLDSLKNLHQKFLSTNSMTIGYSLFCQLRPFWVVEPKLTDRDTCACVTHENVDLKLVALKYANILNFATHQSALQTVCCDRYSEKCLSRTCDRCSMKNLPYNEFDNSDEILVKQWRNSKELIKDITTKKERYVMKYKKETQKLKPYDLIGQLEETDLPKLFQHEMNIVHQYNTVKSLKESLTEKDAIIHMDFSENYTTKCNQEIQSYHFGGSRTQISLHTVVVYSKDMTTSHCTVSLNLAHGTGAIWAHLEPVLATLPSTVENLHFLSDGPVTQYRNKTMFYILGCRIQDFYPLAISYSWNFHEAGHGKGAPDGVGATCKRSADKHIAQHGDITNLHDFVVALREKCPGIKVSIIEDVNIDRVNKMIKENEDKQKAFKGTLLVHQVRGNVYMPNRIFMKALSCFCDDDGCEHFKLGTLEYQTNINRLQVSTVYSDSEDDVPLASTSRDWQEISKTNYGSGDYVLIKLTMRKKEYRYAAICSKYDEVDGELTVAFLKVSNDHGTEFKLNDNDIADVPYEDVIEKLPVPKLVNKRNTTIYRFNKPVNVFEK
ncbi:uncharacterized protein LOC132904255 [Amyelois transitella]|uniref:uncharacterized protein LOC132901927 n=1 Tax=Amyelois transitella TaxID=680683 RepID=UPI00067A89B1|nr:uncharacterized protein LOC132901927 [Amyelois transitella]XP_060803858.1 uncharacterized protein LOC132902511 [Amyelois transitella]XP_060810165.1 uncharacterized protein LOC132904255 [Amyelois transitella]